MLSSTAINEYCEEHSTPDSELLQHLQRETFVKAMLPNMISSPLQGRILSLISKLISPKFILEIGTFTGYAALCMAEGLRPDGELHTIDINEEMSVFHEEFFAASPYSSKIKTHYGNAHQLIPTLHFDWDIVFIDADKQAYADYYDLLIDKLIPGAVLIADNVLWKGKVIETEMDKDTACLHSFNKKVNNDPRVENVLLPIRDGLMMLKKI
jgi:caffeoyl-CoA O-methyltransferase